MPNMIASGGTEDNEVACIILCCDRKSYDMRRRPLNEGETNCRRLGNRKHWCVRRNIKKLENDKIQAEPRHYKEDITNPDVLAYLNKTGKSFLSPDIVLPDSKLAYDAKFPCDEEKLNKKKGKPFPGLFRSTKEAGESRSGEKEDLYGKLPGVKRCEPMSPDDAQEKNKEDGVTCDCSKATEK